jgi:hypothetical protein
MIGAAETRRSFISLPETPEATDIGDNPAIRNNSNE